MDIEEYIKNVHEQTSHPTIRESFHQQLRDNFRSFCAMNTKKYGKVKLHYFRSPNLVSEVVVRDKCSHVIYNQLSGDLARIIHYMALSEDFNNVEFATEYIAKAVASLVDGELPNPAFWGSQTADQATSVTELFILYHEYGHIAFKTNRSLDSLVEVLIRGGKETAVHALRDSVPTYQDGKLLTVEGLFEAIAERASNFEKIYDSDGIKEEVFCDLFSADIVRQTYRNLGDEENLVRCGTALLTYSIISEIFELARSLSAGTEIRRENSLLFRARANVFLGYLLSEGSEKEFLRLRSKYRIVDQALDSVFAQLSPYSGNLIEIKRATENAAFTNVRFIDMDVDNINMPDFFTNAEKAFDYEKYDDCIAILLSNIEECWKHLRLRHDCQPIVLLARAYSEVGFHGEALQLLSEVVDETPNDAFALQVYGYILRRAGQPDHAVEMLQQSIELIDTDADAWNNLGLAYKDIGYHEGAIYAYKRSLRLNPFQPMALSNLARYLAMTGDISGAAELLERALEIEPNNRILIQNIHSLKKMMESSKL